MTVVGFVDEDRDAWTRTWQGVPIYKPRDLESLIADKKFDGLVLSNARLEGDQLLEMIRLCGLAGLPVRRFQIHWPEIGNGAEPGKENRDSPKQLSIEEALPSTGGVK
jgi:FlaA1/EpsC-like NDP-sugar epimerase